MSKNKGTKTVILTDWFVLDQILFGQSPGKVLEQNVFEKYVTNKGAFLSNLYEIYHRLGYDPDQRFKKVSEMVVKAKEISKTAVETSKELLQKDNVRKLVREEVQELSKLEGLTEKQVAHYVIMKRLNAVAIDSALLENVIEQSGDKKKLLLDWQGKVLIDSHKTLRDQLIEIAMQ